MQDKSVHSGGHIWRQEWAPDGAFYPGGGVLHIMTCMGRLLAKGVPFLCFRYTKE